MKYLLDTDICVYWLKADEHIEHTAISVGLGNVAISFENLNDALQYAEQDLKDRWNWYKERYKRRLKK